MKKHQLHTVLIAGLLAGSLAVGAAATVGVQRIAATLRPDITVKVNGDAQTMYDKNGQVVHPIVYEGSTYLPIRAVGELLEQEVVWDTKTQTVCVNTRTETAPGELTYDALSKRSVKLSNRYTTLDSDFTDTPKAGTYAENLTIFGRLENRRAALRDDLKSLQVDASEARRTGTITRNQLDVLLRELESLDAKLVKLHDSLLEKYGIDETAAAYKVLLAQARELEDDLTQLRTLTKKADQAGTQSVWKQADAAARESWKSFRNDVTALQVALNDSLRQAAVTYAEYNEISELAGALDVACKAQKETLDQAAAKWSGETKPDAGWGDKDAEFYADQVTQVQSEADDLFARCRDYFTKKDRDIAAGRKLMAAVDTLDDRIDELEDAVEDSAKLGRESRWTLLRSLDKAENTLEKAEKFLDKAGVEDDYGHGDDDD